MLGAELLQLMAQGYAAVGAARPAASDRTCLVSRKLHLARREPGPGYHRREVAAHRSTRSSWILVPRLAAFEVDRAVLVECSERGPDP